MSKVGGGGVGGSAFMKWGFIATAISVLLGNLQEGCPVLPSSVQWDIGIPNM